MILAWTSLAVVALLVPALWRDSPLPLGDAVLVVAVLGFAAERASYLVGAAAWAGRRRVRCGWP